MADDFMNRPTEPICPFTFTDYDKISDTLMWLSPSCILKFCVRLKFKNKNGDYISFHSEYKTYNESTEREMLSISLNQSAYFTIECKDAPSNYVILRPNDIAVINMVYNNNILPWYVGEKRIFSIKDNEIVVTGKYSPVDVPLNNNMFLRFSPILITYEDNVRKEGIRVTINTTEYYVDLTVDRMFEFFYYLCNTDMVTAAFSLLSYAKTQPYGENFKDLAGNKGKKKFQHNTFFDKL